MRARVRGRVQGVGFRWATEAEARRLGVFGSVRNLPGGDVEAVVEGEPGAVEAALAFLRVGPHAATVSGVEVQEEPPHGFDDFKILRS